MPRNLKPQKVAEMRLGPNGERADVMLDRNDLLFFAEEYQLGSAERTPVMALSRGSRDRIEARSADDLKAAVYREWDARPRTEWTPWIILSHPSQGTHSYDRHGSSEAHVNIDISLGRCWITDTGSQLRKADWNRYSERPGGDMRFNHSYQLDLKPEQVAAIRAGQQAIDVTRYSSTSIYLPFTEVLWEQLHTMIGQITQLGAALVAIIQRPQLPQLLEHGSLQLSDVVLTLPVPKED